MTQGFDSDDPCLQERPPASAHAAPANAVPHIFNEAVMPIGCRSSVDSRGLHPASNEDTMANAGNEEYEEFSIAEPHMSNIFKTLSNQMAKSMNRCWAKMQKQDINKIAKRLAPDRDNKKENRKTKIGSALDGLSYTAMSAIKPEDENEIRLLEQQVVDCHREKISTVPLNIMGAVVKVLTRRDAEWHSDLAKAALMKEMNKLTSAGVWDLVPVSMDAAFSEHSDASFTRLFEILGIKNSELVNEAIYKA